MVVTVTNFLWICIYDHSGWKSFFWSWYLQTKAPWRIYTSMEIHKNDFNCNSQKTIFENKFSATSEVNMTNHSQNVMKYIYIKQWGLNEKETELNHRSIFSISTFNELYLFARSVILNRVKLERAAIFFKYIVNIVKLTFSPKTLIWMIFNFVESSGAGAKWSSEDFIRKYYTKLFFLHPISRGLK